MKLNIKEALNFFDNAKNSRGHASAVVGIIGEDLNVFAFKHYMKSKGNEVEVLNQKDGRPSPVTQGKRTGKRLDRWIISEPKNDKKLLYQCEIKNWSATAVGGRSLDINAKNDDIREVASHHWRGQLEEFKKTYKKSTISKVLTPMKVPEEYKSLEDTVRPLLIYWMPILKPTIKDIKFFFPVCVSKLPLPINFKKSFKTLYIFSVSIYFRQLISKGKKEINFDSSIVEKRMNNLNKIIR